MLLSSIGAYTLGCEITDRSIKIVQIKKGGLSSKIISVGHTLLKEGIIDNGKILQEDALKHALLSAISKIRGKKLSTIEAVLSLPNSQTFIKTISMERKEHKSVDKLIQKEIDKHFPLDPNESYFDHQILNDNDGSIEVIIAAVSMSIAQPYIDLTKRVGWHLVALELESIAISRALLGKEIEENALIIDLGHAHSSLIIVSNKTVQFTLSLPISGKVINETISHKLKLRIDQAEKAKIKCGLDENKCKGALKIVLDAILDDLAFKIEDALAYYDDHRTKNSNDLNKILITGGGAHLLNIEKVLSTKLKREVVKNQEIKNLKAINIKSFPEITDKNLNAYMTPIGLALRGVYNRFV